MTNLVSKAFSSLLNKLGSPARVLAVRPWGPRSIYELELHLPTVDMTKWTSIPRLKCRVAEFEFRDYSPATWDAVRRSCTLYIETSHEGPGSRWVRQLQAGDPVAVGPAYAEKLPAAPGPVLALADGSALGHLLALQQLTDPATHPLEACVAFPTDYDVPAHLREANPAFEFLNAPAGPALAQWLLARPLSRYTAIYVAGNMKLVADLRRQLRARPEVQARLYVKGFWQ